MACSLLTVTGFIKVAVCDIIAVLDTNEAHDSGHFNQGWNLITKSAPVFKLRGTWSNVYWKMGLFF